MEHFHKYGFFETWFFDLKCHTPLKYHVPNFEVEIPYKKNKFIINFYGLWPWSSLNWKIHLGLSIDVFDIIS
jgi:hypothetical protein